MKDEEFLRLRSSKSARHSAQEVVIRGGLRDRLICVGDELPTSESSISQ
jgi:hypothetical protein